ncbi:MAG: hypothetical protein M3Z41_02785 [Candidatus Eremiobacteraeota bacterium]|nr:hypothetical protein [Candidatus Eremiobacteraeota bacterium]
MADLIEPDHPFTNLILLIEFNPHVNRQFYDDPHFPDHINKLLEGEGYAPFRLTESQREVLSKRPPHYPSYASPGDINNEIDKEFKLAGKSHDSDNVVAVLHVQVFPVRK